MIRATEGDDELIVDILSRAFDDEQTLNYSIKQDKRRAKSIRLVMLYSIEVARIFGEIYLSDNRKACTLLIYPEKKKCSPLLAWINLKSIIKLRDVAAAMRYLKYENVVLTKRPKEKHIQIWYLGVFPAVSHQGIGTHFLTQILAETDKKKLPVCLETATFLNISWYNRFGFEVYDQTEGQLVAYLMRRPVPSTHS